MKTNETVWRELAQRTSLRLVAGYLISRVMPVAVVSAIVLATVLYGLRFYGVSSEAMLWTTSAIVVLSLAIAAYRARSWRQYADESLACSRLDSALGLNNALAAAYAGRGPWPKIRPEVDDRLRFNLKRILPPFLLPVSLLTAAFYLPLPASAGAGQDIPPPKSHEDLAAAIAELEKAELLKPEALEQWKKQLEEIASQPAADWYSHSSLEAADNLQSAMDQQLGALSQKLAQAQNALGGLEAAGSDADSSRQKELASEFKAATEALKKSNLAVNDKLMSALSKIDPSAIKSLDQKSLQQMMEGLKKAGEACKNCQGKCNGGNGEAQSELDNLIGNKSGNGKKDAGDGNEQTGRGGVKRGPGVAPLPLSDSPTDLKTDKPETLQADDFSRARPGDAIGTLDTEHKLDKSPTGPQSSGGAADQGRGGEAVWRESFLPGEKAVLKKYFK